MKKIKSAVFDSIRIKDIGLTLRKNEIAEIPDDVFQNSKDIKKCLEKKQIIMDYSAVPSIQKNFSGMPESAPLNIHTRLNILERSVSTLLSKNWDIDQAKYEDYLLYSSTFLSADYDAMLLETFTDDTKRSKNNPGTAPIKHGCLFNDDTRNFSDFNSLDFEFEKPITKIFAMMRWSNNGHARMYAYLGPDQVALFNPIQPETNALFTPIEVNPSKSARVTLALKATYNPVQIFSYCVLFKF